MVLKEEVMEESSRVLGGGQAELAAMLQALTGTSQA